MTHSAFITLLSLHSLALLAGACASGEDSVPPALLIVRGQTSAAETGPSGAFVVRGGIERGYAGQSGSWLYLGQPDGSGFIVEPAQVLRVKDPVRYFFSTSVVLPDGAALVGTSRSTGRIAGDPWLTHLSPTGVATPVVTCAEGDTCLRLWALVRELPNASSDHLVGVAQVPVSPSILGSPLVVYDLTERMAASLAVAGAVGAPVVEDVPPAHPVDGPAFRSVHVGPAQDGVWAVGQVLDPNDEPTWLGRLSRTGEVSYGQYLEWIEPGPEKPNPRLVPSAVATRADGVFAVVGRVYAHNDGRARSWVRQFSPTGETLFEKTYLDPIGERTAAGAVFLDGGELLVLGHHPVGASPEPGGTAQRYAMWLTQYAADGTPTVVDDDVAPGACEAGGAGPVALLASGPFLGVVSTSSTGTSLEWARGVGAPAPVSDPRWIFPPGGPYSTDDGNGAPCGREWPTTP